MFVYDVPKTAGVGQLQIHVPPDFADQFYWRTATPFHLCHVWGWFCTMMDSELSVCKA